IETQAQLNEMSQQQTPALDFAQTRAQALKDCQRVAAIVDAKEPAAEAEEYKRWLLWIGRRVAAAATESTGEPVSAEEAALLGEIAAALGVQEHHAGAEPVVSPQASAPQAPAEVTSQDESTGEVAGQGEA